MTQCHAPLPLNTLLQRNVFELFIVTAFTTCPFSIKKCAKMSVLYVKTLTIRWRLDAKPPVAEEYLRFFNKKTCDFSHSLLKIYFYLLQKHLQHVTEPWILVIWLIHPACSMMINTLAMTSIDKYNGPSSVGHN